MRSPHRHCVARPSFPAASTGGTRRQFLAASTAAGAALAANLSALQSRAWAQGGDTLRLGLIGCGGRGRGAALQALSADPNTRLVALGDAFPDKIKQTVDQFSKNKVADRAKVDPERQFVGFDAYKKVIEAGVDVVLLTAPPHFRPAHLKAAIDAGKHVFCEKPVAVDGPGVRSVQATVEQARAKKLALVSGLCWRYHDPKRETFKRLHDGAIGDIVAIQCTYNTGGLWVFPRQPEWSDMEWQMRNWLYFTWLSGDHIVEQAVHSIDKAAWALKDQPPLKATGTGGRQARTAPNYGHIFDHFAIFYEYADGKRVFHFSRQQDRCANEVTDQIIGTKGVAHSMSHRIIGENAWQYAGPDNDMYQTEHNELFASIRKGEPINNGDYMTKSTLWAIMGRMAAYTGQTITWEHALNSKEDLTPPRYDWGPLPVPPVAVPGVTKFV